MCTDETCQSPTGSRRSAPLRGSCAAVVGLVEISGWLLKGLSFWPRLLATLAVDGGWKRADVDIRPYKVVDGASVHRIPGDIL